jgi:hypothetical protein
MGNNDLTEIQSTFRRIEKERIERKWEQTIAQLNMIESQIILYMLYLLEHVEDTQEEEILLLQLFKLKWTKTQRKCDALITTQLEFMAESNVSRA